MREQRGINFLRIILLSLFLISFVSAEMLISENNVRYDSRLIEAFGDSEWVEVLIDFDENSNWEGVLFILSDKEIRSISEWDYSNRINAEITEEGLEKLLGDDRIKSIYYDFSVQASNENIEGNLPPLPNSERVKSNKTFLLFFITGGVLILFMVLFLSIKFRRGHFVNEKGK